MTTMIIIGGLILAAIVLGGLLEPYRQKRRYVCGCGCNLALHNPDPSDSQCFGHKRIRNYSATGGRSGHAWVDCRCAHYVGRRPEAKVE